MADLPGASLRIDEESGSFGTGTDYLVVMGAVGTDADGVPRVFASTKALLAKHDYAPAVDYCAMHFQETGKPVIFVGLDPATSGTIGQQDDSGVSGEPLEEMDISLIVTDGGTIGTDLIRFDLSLDGGDTYKSVRLGTAATYAIPYVGLTFHFAAGDLDEDDTYTAKTTAPRHDQAGLAAARAALAAQQKPARSWLLVGDLEDADDADDVTDEVNAYETENDRFVYVRAQVRDQRPLVQLAHRSHRMAGGPSLTFVDNGGSDDTVVRSSGSWIDDGFVVGDFVTFAGSISNNITKKITALSATVLSIATASVTGEGPVADMTAVGYEGLTFTNSGASDTLARTNGSWLLDGFRAGDTVTIAGTSSNDATTDVIVTATAHTLTFGAGTTLVNESHTANGVTIVGTLGEEMADWVSNVDADFDGVDDEKRLDLGAGRGRKSSPITGYNFRRPVSWAASLREYQHDVQIPNWRKTDGPCDGWDLQDDDGNTVEYDERTQGGLLAARFTCFRSFSNGPNGAFIALSLTRASEGSLLSRTHNMAVTNVLSTIVQAETENFIGQVLELNSDGTGTEASLSELERRVNSAIAIGLLQRKAEGPRASAASWTASRTDILNVPGAELTGEASLLLNGTIEKVRTTVKVQTAGA